MSQGEAVNAVNQAIYYLYSFKKLWSQNVSQSCRKCILRILLPVGRNPGKAWSLFHEKMPLKIPSA